jgi:hypothetical protein
VVVELHTPAEFEDRLETLKILLLDLSESVSDGSQLYNFARFVGRPKHSCERRSLGPRLCKVWGPLVLSGCMTHLSVSHLLG